jgi:hypothetical protein
MLDIAPLSVLLMAVLGLGIVLFAVARIVVLERRVQRPAPALRPMSPPQSVRAAA